jgi:hypothetical protein
LFSNQVLHIKLFKLQIVVFHAVTLKFTELFPHILSHLRQKVDKMQIFVTVLLLLVYYDSNQSTVELTFLSHLSNSMSATKPFFTAGAVPQRSSSTAEYSARHALANQVDPSSPVMGIWGWQTLTPPPKPEGCGREEEAG